jgi:hypothetical protein
VDDGRLDLDDLGEVIDVPGPDEVSASEVLDDGRGYTWTDRLEDSGVTPWLRRHRLAVAGVATAAVLAAAGVTAYVRLTPPPLDPMLHVTAADVVPTPVIDGEDLVLAFDHPGIYPLEDGDVQRAAYVVAPTDSQDPATYAVLGLDGPGVRASAAHPQTRTAAIEGTAVDVDVVLDCDDPATLLPALGSYSLRVARTDTWGRTVVGSVPLDDTFVSWPASVSSSCTWRQTDGSVELVGAAVRAEPGGRAVSLELDVVNRLPVDVRLAMTPTAGAPAVDLVLEPTPVGPGQAATLWPAVEIRDCGSPALFPIGWVEPGADESVITSARPGASLTVEVVGPYTGSSAYPPPMGGTAVFWSESFAREIDAALARACAGAPRATLRVTSVGPAARIDVPLPGDSHADTLLPLTLEVAAPGATRVAVGSPEPVPGEYVGSRVTPSSVRATDGRAVMRTTWMVDCAGGGLDTPALQLVVRTDEGEFPFVATVRSATLADAVLAACGRDDIDRRSLTMLGWDPPSD